jgi:hypothetical protein
MVLLGVLLNYFDVATGMILFSIIQLFANGWRVVQWRGYVLWPIFGWYVVGAIAFVPDKATVYLALGLMPFAVEALPAAMRPNIEWRGVPFVTGVATTIIQILAGVGGLFLDIFFQKSALDRKTTNATKAVAQSFSHVVRALYFGSLSGLSNSRLFSSTAAAVCGDQRSGPPGLAEHLHRAVERHQAGFHAKLRVPLSGLLAELRERRPVRFGFHLRVCDFGLAIGDLGSAAVPMIDRDHLLDAVQLDRCGKIVPKCLVPILKRRRDDADCGTGNDELAELAGQILLDRVLAHRLLHARIDASQNHRLVVPFGRQCEIGREGQGCATDCDGAHKLPAIEDGCQTATARAGGFMQLCRCASHRPSGHANRALVNVSFLRARV